MKQCPYCKKMYDDPSANACDDCGVALVNAGPASAAPSYQQPQIPSYTATPPTAPLVSVKCRNCSWTGSLAEEYCPDCGFKLESNPQPTMQSPPFSTNNTNLPPPPPPPPSPLLILELVYADSTKLAIDQFPKTVGRTDVVRYPDSDYVSRKHASFYYENNQFYIEDANSANGTSLNGQKIGSDGKSMGKMPLKDGDIVQFAVDEKGEGGIKFTVRVVKLPK